MRELKFRFWDGKEMALLHLDDWTFFNGELCHRNAPLYPVMQYTGLKDKNGKEIYEGDIINSKIHNPENYQVEFIEGGFCCTHPKVSPYTTDINHFYPSTGCKIEVIGNIHENKDLL